jgi:hypothetical protein
MSRVNRRSGWEYFGEIGVDSGQMMLCDPCYIEKDFEMDFTSDTGKEKPKGGWPMNYDGACLATLSDKECGILGAGTAAVCSTGYGDGVYPVYVQREDGRIMAMKIDFDPEDDDNEL